jgi:hypothetical protein
VKSFRWAWDDACRLAGCPDRLLHDLRRTAVRNPIRAGVPERVAMQLTGHKTRSVFERYNIVSEGDLRAAARTLDAAHPKQRAARRSRSVEIRAAGPNAQRRGQFRGQSGKLALLWRSDDFTQVLMAVRQGFELA